MSAADLAEATREFDKPLACSRPRPLSRAERDRFVRALHAGEKGRQLVAGRELDPELAPQAEVHARRKKLTLSPLVEQGLRRELAVTR